ncbi:unnamed protein product [Caenorhabditis sp. 36 PRJEB53466]|nr:unnamed protein product [Caenorhabditis sp. 36 PRJEB53466]
MASRKHQGVISGSLYFNKKEYVEIFDKEYKYLYGYIDDLFVNYGNWVEYNIVEAPTGHPQNCRYLAKNICYVDGKKSMAPTSDEFRSNDMNVRDYNKVDYFEYETNDNVLAHKSTIQRDPGRHNQYYNNYYGDVIVPADVHRRLLEHRIDKLDVKMSLIPSSEYTSGPHWQVVHYIHQGKLYSINGYLSITGHVLRGPGGVVRNRSEVTVAPDALRPRNAVSSFGNAPTGSRGLGALAASRGFGSSPRAERLPISPMQEKVKQRPLVKTGILEASLGSSRMSRLKAANADDSFWGDAHGETTDPFNRELADSISQTTVHSGRLTLNSTTMTTEHGFGGGRGFGRGGGGFGNGGGFGRREPIGLARFGNAQF